MPIIPVLFDTDGGVDDYSALWYALVSDSIDVVGVTTVRGVIGATEAARNVAKVLVAAGRTDVPFAAGAEEQLGPRPAFPPPTLMHGDDGLGNTNVPDVNLETGSESAVDMIVRMARERPGELTLVAVGPFTNVALALRREPCLPELLKDLVIMGGAAQPPGNCTALAEFNVGFDPVAANKMVLAPWPKPPLMVGLDVTMKATMSEAELAVLNARETPQARFMAGPFELYRAMSELEAVDGCPVHDTLAMMSVDHPEVLQVEELPMIVDTAGGAAWGATVVDFRARSLDSGKIPEAFVEIARQEMTQGKGIWRIALGADVELARALFRDCYAA